MLPFLLHSCYQFCCTLVTFYAAVSLPILLYFSLPVTPVDYQRVIEVFRFFVSVLFGSGCPLPPITYELTRPSGFVYRSHSLLSIFLPPPDFQALTAVDNYATLHMGTKKTVGTSFIRCPPLVGGIYTVSPGEHHNWIFASEGLYSLCHNNTYRNHNIFIYRVIPPMGQLENWLQNYSFFLSPQNIPSLFLQFSTVLRIFVCKLVYYVFSRTALVQKKTATFRQRSPLYRVRMDKHQITFLV